MPNSPPIDRIKRVFDTPTAVLADRHDVLRHRDEPSAVYQKRVLLAALKAAFRRDG